MKKLFGYCEICSGILGTHNSSIHTLDILEAMWENLKSLQMYGIPKINVHRAVKEFDYWNKK